MLSFFDSVGEEGLRKWIEDAESGKRPESALSLLENYHQHIQHGCHVPDVVHQYIARAVEHSLVTKLSFEQAAGLKARRGKTSKIGRDLNILTYYNFVRQRLGLTDEQAFAELAESQIFSKQVLSPEAIKKAVRSAKKYLEEHPEE